MELNKFHSYVAGAIFNILMDPSIGFMAYFFISSAGMPMWMGRLGGLAAGLASFTYFGLLGIYDLRSQKDFVPRAVPTFFGSRVNWFVVPEGFVWMLPPPFMGVIVFNTQLQTISMLKTTVLSQDNKVGEIDLQFQHRIVDVFAHSQLENPGEDIRGEVLRHVRLMAQRFGIEELPRKKSDFSVYLEQGAGAGTDTPETTDDLHVKLRAWGVEVVHVPVTDIRIPKEITDALAQIDVEKAQKDSETVEIDNLRERAKALKLDFPGLTDKQVMDIIQAERNKITRVVVEGDAGDFTKGQVAGQVLGGNRGTTGRRRR